MFSYMSTKNSKSTLENNIIDEIQSIANDIFDFHQSSTTRTQQQELSLELSSATDEQRQFIDQEENLYSHQEQLYISNILNHQLKFEQPITKTVHPSQYRDTQNNQHDSSSRRLTKSMISGHASIKEPGSFSNNYLPNKNISASHVSAITKNHDQQKEKKIGSSAIKQMASSALKPSSLNKSNILMGILHQSQNKTSSKTPNKKGKFSSSYASNYLSPYSTKGIKENPKSYMEKSNSKIKKQKSTLEFQYIKQKINQNIEPQISYRKEKQERNRLKNPKLSNVKSKYKQVKPIMHEYKLYADEHIYKKIKTQMGVWEQKKKRYETLSNEQIECNWQQFIHKEKRFLEDRKKSILNKQLEHFHKQNIQCSYSPSKNIVLNGKNSMISVNPAKMTPQDYIKKYKREKEKLKEKLEANEISNFVQKSYDNSKRYGKQIFDSVWGSNYSRQSVSSHPEGFSTVKQTSAFQMSQIQKVLIENTSESSRKPHQNFFISVGDQNQNKSLKKKLKEGNLTQHKNNSSSKKKDVRKSNSKQAKSTNHQSNSAKKHQPVNALSPFIRKSAYFSKNDSTFKVHEFDPRHHNSPLFNEKITKGRSKSKTPKNQTDSNRKVSELLNPKYFKSINELQEYSSNSRQKIDQMKKTFEVSKSQSKQQDNSISINEKDLSYDNFRRSPQKNSKQSQGSGFDQRLMNKIIHDLDQMRSQIQQNKKKRKYRIENYRNISNLRKNQDENLFEKEDESQKQMSQSIFQCNSQHVRKQSDEIIKRENHRFPESIVQKNNHSSNRMKILPNVYGSRSVSPIQKEDSILANENNLSFSIIEPSLEAMANSGIKNLQLSQFSSRMANSSMVMVKSRQEMEFVFKN